MELELFYINLHSCSMFFLVWHFFHTFPSTWTVLTLNVSHDNLDQYDVSSFSNIVIKARFRSWTWFQSITGYISPQATLGHEQPTICMSTSPRLDSASVHATPLPWVYSLYQSKSQHNSNTCASGISRAQLCCRFSNFFSETSTDAHI